MEQSGLPLFFKNPQMLSPERHANAGILQDKGMGFARNTNSIIITTSEFVEAAKFYPIVFTQNENPAPVVMIGLEQNNYFVDSKGVWKKDAYIPAYARQYPFVFAETPGSDKLTLCVDEDAEHFTQNVQGENTPRLFEKDSKPSQFTNSALKFCAGVQKENAFTQGFSQAVQENNLLQPQEMEAKLASGKVIRLNGFQVINHEKLLNLSSNKITELHKNGFLPLIYFMILSMSNWQRLIMMAEKAAAH